VSSQGPLPPSLSFRNFLLDLKPFPLPTIFNNWRSIKRRFRHAFGFALSFFSPHFHLPRALRLHRALRHLHRHSFPKRCRKYTKDGRFVRSLRRFALDQFLSIDFSFLLNFSFHLYVANVTPCPFSRLILLSSLLAFVLPNSIR